jgi:nucleotide-binding universal stress UspA family protein
MEVKILTVVEKQELASDAEHFLKDVSTRLKEALPAAEVTIDVGVGDSREVILETATAWKADLVVMGARGRRGLSRLILGSVSQTVLLYSPCSTLIARAEDNARMRPITHILMPVDDSPHSRNAINWLLQSPWTTGSRIRFLTVMPTLAEEYSIEMTPVFNNTISEQWDADRARAQQFLDKTVADVKEKLPESQISSKLEEGEVASSIIKEIQAFGAQLVIMGSRGNRGLKKIWLGSVSQEVVLQAPIPVEVIKFQHQA